MMSKAYQDHLNRVSRSFSFCIARLEGDFQQWVALSYLLCRILDTVEDAKWLSVGAQEQAYRLFHRFLHSDPSTEELAQWVDSFPPSLPEGEKILLQDSQSIFQDLHLLPKNVQQKILRGVTSMHAGMHFFHLQHRAEGNLRLRNLSEVNQYCFFVAGLVGELLTDLLLEKSPRLDSSELYLDSYHFGLFLQKINLLKDQKEDEKEGRFLVPSRKELLASLTSNVEGAIRYILALPVTEKGYRLFCAWSLFLGLASLPWIEKSWALGFLHKIPRALTDTLLGRVEKVIDDNQALWKLFQDMLPALPKLSVVQSNSASLPWMGDLYKGRLGQAQFFELGMMPEPTL